MSSLPGSRSKSVTIYDVAKQAGVSTATVSRVINQTSFVTEETRERVQAAIAYLGYVPSATARRLSAGRSSSIALLISWKLVSDGRYSTLALSVARFTEAFVTPLVC